ncbi:hypothetical protein B566_EDAN008358 [Ephemera danica]|nr:hypothetical protein B566_EDAN008358 [Ephemera danica]
MMLFYEEQQHDGIPEVHDQETAACSWQSKRKASTSQSSSKKKATTCSMSQACVAGPSTSQDTRWNSSIATEREECPVCRKQLGRKPIAIPDCCSHSYCYECINAWVTKAKSNCPMDRKEIKFLKVYEKGQLVSTEPVEHKVPEEEEVTPEDEGEICPVSFALICFTVNLYMGNYADLAHVSRLAKLLGLRPPKDPRQSIPRGCRPRPITAAQRAAAASSASTSGMVTARPIGSLSYHHRAQPTLHLFGGDELEYFPSDSDSECGNAGEGGVSVHYPHTSRSSEARVARQKEIGSPTLPSSSSVDILGSILESQSHMRTPFDILGDGSILRRSKNGESSSSPRRRPLNLGSVGNSASRRPGSESSEDSRWARAAPADPCSQHSVQSEYVDGSEHSNNVPSSSSSYYSQRPTTSIDIARSFANDEEEEAKVNNHQNLNVTIQECQSESVGMDKSAAAAAAAAAADSQCINSSKSKKSKRRKSLVEEIFGSDVEDCTVESSNAVNPVPASPTVAALGTEGLEFATVEDGNPNVVAIEESSDMKCDTITSTPGNSEEGDIIEICSKVKAVVTSHVVLDEESGIDNVTSASPLSPDPPTVASSQPLLINVVATEEKLLAKADREDRSSKPKIPERKVERDERKKKNCTSTEAGKSNSGNVEWKRTWKSSKDRNYRDGKAKENVSRDRNEKREQSNRDDRRSKNKKEKRKDLERYDVRKVINERSRREAERRRDQFGRDISRDHSHSRSPSRSPRPLSHHQPRHRRRSREASYTSAVRNRGHRYRNESCSSSRSSSGSSWASSPPPHHSTNRPDSRDDKHRRVRAKSRSPSPVRSLSRDVARSSRRERSCSFSRVTPGLVTIVTGRERPASTSHLMDSVISASVANLASNGAKKKGEKGKEKQKKDCKKKKKERYRDEVDVTTGSSCNKQLGSAAVVSCDKRKHRRERSPPASKEVFASGDSILVSVNFNTCTPSQSLIAASSTKFSKEPNSHQSTQIAKRAVKSSQQSREEIHARNISPRPQRSVIRQVKQHPERHETNHPTLATEKSSHSTCPSQSRGTANGINRRKRIAAEIAAKRKPMAIIDLEASPFAERAPSPAEIITLSDEESSSRTNSSSQSSHRSSIDDRREERKKSKEERSMGQRKTLKCTKKKMERQISVSTAGVNSIAMVALGPKTPPEPQIKFSINAKPQLRSILNPLHDEDDDIDLDATLGADMELRNASNSAVPTLLMSSHAMPANIRGPNTPPEPCLVQNRSSSAAKLDMETTKGKKHVSPSCVDAKSPDAYDPFEPTKSPSDVSSCEEQLGLSQSNLDRLSEVCDSLLNTQHFTPRSDSDESVHSSQNVSHTPVSPPAPADPKTCDKEIDKKKEQPHPNTQSQQSRSPATNSAATIADSKQVPEMKPAPAALLFPPSFVTAQGLLSTVPPSVLCAPHHPGLYQPQLTVPFLLSTPSLLGLRVSQQTLLAASQQVQQQSTLQQTQQQQPDTTTTTDVVDMDLESPYSPASSEGDDLFEPPEKTQTSAYLSRREKSHANKKSHSKSNVDKFDMLLNQSSTPLKKEVSSTSGNRGGAQLTGRTSHGRKTSSRNHHKLTKLTIVQKTRRKNISEKIKSGKKEIAIRMDDDQLKILDNLPSSAVEMQVKEKFLKKLNRQERVVEEVKLALKPHYTKKVINKQEYKDILRRAVPKICHNKTGEINPIRIRLLIGEYVKKFRHAKKKESTKHRGKTEKQRC